jgi:hypothetical protein
MSIIPAFGRLGQDCDLEASLSYLVRPCLKKNKQTKKKERKQEEKRKKESY